jgi:hypothetical protein
LRDFDPPPFRRFPFARWPTLWYAIDRTRYENALQEADLPIDLTRKIAAVFRAMASLPR